MKLERYVELLIDVLAKNPDAGNLIVVTSTAYTGSGYKRISHAPSLGTFDGTNFEPFNSKEHDPALVNAVLV